LQKINPKGEKQDGIVKFNIEALIKSGLDTYKIKPGFTAVADIEVDKDTNSLIVFEKDIVMSNDSIFLEVMMNNDFIKKQLIKTGTSDGIRTAVIAGIDTTMLIIKQ